MYGNSSQWNKVNEPIYNDYFSGLGICVDGLYGNRIEVTSYEFDGVNYKYTLHFTMYDIFGLDSSDITDNYISFAPPLAYLLVLEHGTFCSIMMNMLGNISLLFHIWSLIKHSKEQLYEKKERILYLWKEQLYEKKSAYYIVVTPKS